MNNGKKCKICNGKGIKNNHDICTICEGSGIQLYSIKEEEFNDASELAGTKIFADQSNFFDLEEE